MPHVILECSSNLLPTLQAGDVCARAYETLVQSGLFKSVDIKVRLYSATDFHVGPLGKEGDFAHAVIHILEGRTLPQRQDLAKAVFALLKEIAPQAYSVTVDVQELDKDIYQKGAPLPVS